jgi:hypothetical protein
MSRRNTVNAKCCKFCKDAGKSEEEYTSHFLRESRDPNSRIICPTLLAIECRFCFKKGHTVSKCNKLAKQKEGSTAKYDGVPGAPKKSLVNVFDLLSSSDEVDDEGFSTDETVASCFDCDTVSSTSTPTYAEMLAKPVPMRSEVGSRLSILTKAGMMRSWADDSDSDEE